MLFDNAKIAILLFSGLLIARFCELYEPMTMSFLAFDTFLLPSDDTLTR